MTKKCLDADRQQMFAEYMATMTAMSITSLSVT